MCQKTTLTMYNGRQEPSRGTAGSSCSPPAACRKLALLAPDVAAKRCRHLGVDAATQHPCRGPPHRVDQVWKQCPRWFNFPFWRLSLMGLIPIPKSESVAVLSNLVDCILRVSLALRARVSILPRSTSLLRLSRPPSLPSRPRPRSTDCSLPSATNSASSLHFDLLT